MKWTDIVKRETVSEALSKVRREGRPFCPEPGNIFRAFDMITPDRVRVCLAGQDPYPQEGVATGILFANKENTPEDQLSPSLRIIKNSFLDFLQDSEKDAIFDPTLAGLVRQGVLMINSAMTVETNHIGSHVLIWRKFTSELLRNLSNMNRNIIFVLFGTQAQTFRPYINRENVCFEVPHPAYYARTGMEEMGALTYYSLWKGINLILSTRGEEEIKWI